jgi:predicted DsbA family dithiol-disulfide isomerase
MRPLKVVHFSDVLCIWAYVGQTHLSRLAEKFGDRLDVEVHYCSVFPDTHAKITKLWHEKGGFDGYARHVQDVANGFENVNLHSDVWSKTRPLSSASPHLFLKAVELLDNDVEKTAFTERLPVKAATALRSAFFTDAEDIADWAIQSKVSQQIGVSFADVFKKIETGEAMAKLAADYELAQAIGVKGSPTYILNNGRQILFGNISYGILEANVSEVLAEQNDLNASPC